MLKAWHRRGTKGPGIMNRAPITERGAPLLLAFLTSIFLVTFVARIVPSPLLPVIEQDLGLVHTAAGGLFLAMAMGYAGGLFFSGFLSARLFHRRSVALACTGCGAAFFLIAASRNLAEVYGGMFLTGFFTGIYLPSGITMITSSFPPTSWGRALAVHELAPSLAFILTPFLAELLLNFFSWQGAVTSLGSLAAGLGLSFLIISPERGLKGEAPTLGHLRVLLGRRAFWIMAVFFSLATTASIGIFSMIPLYLVTEKGMERETANVLLGLSRLPVLPMAIVAGWLSDRFGPKRTIAAVILFNGLTTIMLGAAPGRWVGPVLFLQPLLTVCFFPAGFTILSRLVPAAMRNLSVSLTVFFAYLIGGGLTPILLGVFGDAGMFSAAFFATGIITLACLPLVRRLDTSEIRMT